MRSLKGLSVLILALAIALFISSLKVTNAGTDWHTAPSIEKLEQMINGPGSQEAILEIRLAISQALSLRYVAESYYDAESLRAIAADLNNSEELRRAGREALAELLKQADLSLEELLDLALNGETAELREAADGALEDALVAAVRRGEMEIADLAALVTANVSKELKTMAAEAIFKLLKCKLLDERKVVEGIVSGQMVEIEDITIDGSISFFRLAASDYLANLYIFHEDWFEDPIEELSAITIDASLPPEFRAAASHALAKYLDDSDMSGEELEDLALHGESRELRQAGAKALGRRLAEAFKSEEITITDLLKLAVRGSTLELGAAAIPGLSLFFSGGLEPREGIFDVQECFARGGYRHCPWYAEYCGHGRGYLGWSGDYANLWLASHGYKFYFPSYTRFTVNVDVHSWADFDACLVKQDYCSGGVCHGHKVACDTGFSDPYIVTRQPPGYYWVTIWSYRGSGRYDIYVIGDW